MICPWKNLSRMISPIIRGWINYYARFYKSALYPTLRHLNDILVRWAMRKFKRLRCHLTKAVFWLGGIAKRQPSCFRIGSLARDRRLDDGSPVSREAHAGF